jgi:peptide deformylase
MNETALKIKILGDPVLRKKAKRVSHVSAHHARILSQMARLMYDSKGIGLAAPQVGISESMLVVDIGTGLYKLINPVIVKKSGAQSIEEGCLSCPGIYVSVKRARKISIEALDENGRSVSIDAADLLACVFQHEMDHLDGRMIVDYASFLKKLSLKKKIREMRYEQLSQPDDKHSRL